MGVCGEAHVYDGITREKVDFILEKLKEGNADVSAVGADGPWDIDTHDYGVKLRGEWDKAASQMSITVTAKNLLAPCSLIWQQIDHLMGQV
ncbi:MAG: hypothetical protein L7F77_11155 [Candidatus Magnetominusculus sp. LBB02]|nr:hypothetical protein [Candidatus Magnetominusculus sp. LBB02]